MNEHPPLTEQEEHRDAHDSYFEAIAEIKKRVAAGERLHSMFVPRHAREGATDRVCGGER